MPRAKKTTESVEPQSKRTRRKRTPVSEVVAELKEANASLTTADELPPLMNVPEDALPAFREDHVKHARITTARPFVGRIASGRGRVVHSDDESFSIEANPPLSAGEHALAVKNGFEDYSPDGSLLIADKAEMRAAKGDINHVAYAITSKGAGRGR